MTAPDPLVDWLAIAMLPEMGDTERKLAASNILALVVRLRTQLAEAQARVAKLERAPKWTVHTGGKSDGAD